MEPKLTVQALEGATVCLEPLGRHRLDGLRAVGLDSELWRRYVNLAPRATW